MFSSNSSSINIVEEKESVDRGDLQYHSDEKCRYKGERQTRGVV